MAWIFAVVAALFFFAMFSKALTLERRNEELVGELSVAHGRCRDLESRLDAVRDALDEDL